LQEISLYSIIKTAPVESSTCQGNFFAFRLKTRQIFNTAKHTGKLEKHKNGLTCYNTDMEGQKIFTDKFYHELTDIRSSPRLMKTMTTKSRIMTLSDWSFPTG
jgi:hypothetical protein